MINKDMDRVQKMTFSAMVIALYVTVLYFTQSFSFGAYQIRIATALYALSYLFPFLFFAKRAKSDGQVGGLYLILYSIGRFIIECFRDDPRGSVGPLSTSQFIAIFVLAAGIAIFVFCGKKYPKEAKAEEEIEETGTEKAEEAQKTEVEEKDMD